MAKYIISGGGTGGHIYPAIAIADAIRQLDQNAEVLFVGAEGKMEMQKVPEAGYRIEGLPVAGLQRKLTFNNLLKNLALPFKVLGSINRAKQLLKSFKPDVVIGVGGYASGPILFAAQQSQIPTMLQEQNGYAGLTNKYLGKKAKKICVAYPEMDRFFAADKLVFTGNPLRSAIVNRNIVTSGAARRHFGLDPDQPVLLIIGGSLGAGTLNKGLLQWHQEILKAGYQIIWQTGKSGFDYYLNQLNVLYPHGIPHSLCVLPFLSEMEMAYGAATIVVSRAGALSVAELTLVGKPCILVPSPNVAEDHQTKNAMAVVKAGGAILLKDADFQSTGLGTILSLFNDQDLQASLAASILKLARPDASLRVAEIALQLAKR